jgi:hypothetical protein
MTHEKGTKLEPPLKLDMGFEEALARFASTNPKEVELIIQMAKTRKPLEPGEVQRPKKIRSPRG